MKAAPLTFLITLAVGLVGGYVLASQMHAREITNFETLIRIKDEKIKQYDQLDRRLKDVETVISQQQLSSLKEALSLSPSVVRYLGNQDRESEVVQQMNTTFKESGWTVLLDSSPTSRTATWSVDGAKAQTLATGLDKAGIEYSISQELSSEGELLFSLPAYQDN